MRVPEVAAVLAVTPRSVYRLFASGDLKSVLVNGCRRIKRSDLDAYIERISRAA